MRLETIILRANRSRVPDLVARPGSLELSGRPADLGTRGGGRSQAPRRPAVEVTLEKVELDEKERRDQVRDPNVLEIAPSMPVQLVRPFTAGPTAATECTGESWGISAVAANETPRTGAGVVVAVLDTGIERSHPAFRSIAFRDGDIKNFTGDEDEDTDGHGTHCAGTIFGQDCDGCRIGIARGVTRALIGKVIGRDGGSTEAIYRAMLWAQQEGAHVISMSLGMDFPGYQRRLVERYDLEPEHATSLALAGYRANVRLFDRMSQLAAGPGGAVGGAVVAAAAGNESRRPKYSITVAPPAAAELFLSVGAVGKDETTGEFYVADFSNEGVNVTAPGVDIWSADLGGGLRAMSGTSMATPHVAGVAALWAEVRVAGGTFRASSVVDLMKRHVLPLAPKLAVEDVGEGLPQAPTT